ncbi:MAG: hypothetical protein BM555_06385 [Crocinitomix sp. MedPE-SWsnd]|nr:MAG: hypothetical protein BM555_06385 [Crocinitomix sp. MedPE-SWsnd]
MKCKNCQVSIEESANFCPACGAKNVRSRITLKSIVSEFADRVLGWDNKYFVTIKDMIVRPKLMFDGYIGGVRKKYVNPITFFALGMTISIIIFNFFHNEYLELSSSAGPVSVTNTPTMPDDYMIDMDLTLEKRQELFHNENQTIEYMVKVQETILKYFQIYSFLLLPLYAFFSFLVYRKKYNYGEHLVINAYLQGLMFIVTPLFFIGSLYIWADLYTISFILVFLIYMYVFTKLFEHTFLKSILYLLKFIGIGLAFMIILVLLGFLIGMMITS